MKFENSANRPTASHRQHRPIPFWVIFLNLASFLAFNWCPYHEIWKFGQSVHRPAIGNIGQFHFESNIWIMRRIYLLFDAHIMEFENSADRPTGRPPAHGPTTWRGQPDRLLTWIYEFGVCFDQLFDVLYTCNKKVWNSSQAATCLWADYMAHLHGRVSRIIFDTFTMLVIPFFSQITNLEQIKTEIISP